MATRFWLGSALVVSLAVTACGSDNGSGAASPAQAAGAKAPEGQPFLLGWINQDAPGAVPTYTGTSEAQVAVEYVNGVLGGVAGRPLELVPCSTNGSPESSQSCANAMLSQGVKVVAKNFDGGWDAAIGQLEAADVTVLGGQPTATGEFGAPNTYYFSGGAATVVPAMAKYSTDNLQAKKVVVLTTSNPVAKAALGLLVGPLKAAGVDPTVITAPDDAADFTSFAEAARQAKPDVVAALLTPPQCLPVMKALKGAGYDKPVVTTGLCQDPQIFKAAGAAADGWTFGIAYPSFEASPKEQASVLLRDVWQQFGKGPLAQDAVSQLGVLSVVSVARMLGKIPAADLASTQPGVLPAAIGAVMLQPGVVDPVNGTPLRCQQSKLLPAVCGFGVYFHTKQGDRLTPATGGKPVDGFVQ